MFRTEAAPPPQAAGPSQSDPIGPAAAGPLRAAGGDQRSCLGQVLQHPEDPGRGPPAAELRHHDGATEASALQEGFTGASLDPPPRGLPSPPPPGLLGRTPTFTNA